MNSESKVFCAASRYPIYFSDIHIIFEQPLLLKALALDH